MLSSARVIGFLLLFCRLTTALVLDEIRPWQLRSSRTRFDKRDTSLLNLKSYESFLYGADDDEIYGNFTVYTPGADQNILNMEHFDGMLLSIKCADTGLTLKFEDDPTFAYAKRTWDWVNGNDNHSFIMVAGRRDCQTNDRRIPYLIKTMKFDEKNNIAYLNGPKKEWKDVVKSYDLQVGRVEMPPPGANPGNQRREIDHGLSRRDVKKTLAMNIAQEFPFKIKVETGPVSGELECDECRTTGKINFELRITQNVFGIPNGARFRMTPRGVAAIAKLNLNIASNFKSKKEVYRKRLLSIPLEAISLPGGVLEVGPFLDIDVGIEATAFEGSVTAKMGGKASLSDSAVLQTDLLNPKSNQFSGWKPQVSMDPLEMEAKISLSAQAYLVPAIRLRAEALDQGVQAGLELKMPFVEAKVEGIAASKGGVCDKADWTLGISVEPTFGAELTFTAGKVNDNTPDVNVIIGTASVIGKSICNGWAVGGKPGSGTSKPPPSSGGSTSTSCTSNGVSGTCKSTSACGKEKGKSVAGLCAGSADIQCCIPNSSSSPPPATNEKCTANGSSGTCKATSTCGTEGGQSIAGHCDGAANIQCCIPKTTSKESTTKPPVSGEKCNANGSAGVCKATSTCGKEGGTAKAGFCDGPTDMQCCIPKAAAGAGSSLPANGDKCTASGSSGVCKATSTCDKDGGKSVAGHCDGPTDIQCCIPKAAAPAAGSSLPASGDKCTASGSSGICKATSTCGKDGGKSIAGHCDGPADIQCCIAKPAAAAAVPAVGAACNASGKAGLCKTTAKCGTDGGQSIAGHCDGPVNMQCCIPSAKNKPATTDTSSPSSPSTPSTAPETCTIKPAGATGSCIRTSACKAQGGTATAGFCGGGVDVQCCTYGGCEVKGKGKGVCQPVGSCKGTKTAGLCKGGADIQCCTGVSVGMGEFIMGGFV